MSDPSRCDGIGAALPDPTAFSTRLVLVMIVSSGFGLLALFSLLSILFGEDGRRASDASDSFDFGARWTR